MITETVVNWFLQAVTWLVEKLPDLEPEQVAAVSSFQGRFDQIMVSVAKLSPLIPFSDIGVAAITLMGFFLLALAVQAARIVFSFATLGGGSV